MRPMRRAVESVLVLTVVFVPLVLAFFGWTWIPGLGEIAGLLVVLALFGFGAAMVGDAARKKGRNFYSFFWLSYLVSPVLTGMIVATLPSRRETGVTGTPTSASVVLSDELERLVKLRESGDLSEEEFSLAKKRLLEE